MWHEKKVKMKVAQSCPTLQSHGLCSPWNSPGQNTGVGSRSLLQGIFPTHGSNPGLLHCRQILYQLNHQRSPRILEWVAYPFSCRSPWPWNRTRVSCITGGFFTSWATREAHVVWPCHMRRTTERSPKCQKSMEKLPQGTTCNGVRVWLRSSFFTIELDTNQ